MGPHGGLCGLCGAHSSSCGAFFARIFVIKSIFVFSADFHDFLATKLATPILAVSKAGACTNPWVRPQHNTLITQQYTQI